MKRVLIAIIIISIVSCKKSKTGPGETLNVSPSQAVLVAPANNAPCNEGQVISASESTVQLSWNAAANAESYDVKIKNLLTSAISTHAATVTQLSVNLQRATPYSWYVISKSGKVSTTAQSTTWKFYNAGQAGSSYAPYPADQLIPAMGASINAVNGKISLSWVGEDADGNSDITGYDVYLGNSAATMTRIKENSTTNAISDVAVSSGSTYYWKVLTKDSKGNTSSSEVYNFKVN
ncbi:hypothetical protein WG906_03335 [Pedobacter sp. P351]|uniref:hypothetical protein n=1 Tax=Pedobacter superstes TaxID=3133441 RepID=UPI0030B66DF6